MARLLYVGAAATIVLVAVGLVSPAAVALSASDSSTAGIRHVLVFAFYGLVLVWAPVQHDLAVVAAGPSSIRVRSVPHLTLNAAAVVGAVALFPAALIWRAWWFLPTVPFGFALGLRNMRYAERASPEPAEWRREHVASLVAAGVVLHAALFALLAIRWPAVAATLGRGL